MKTFFCSVFIITAVFFSPARVNAGVLPEYVRVGLTDLSGASVIPIGNGRVAVGYGYDMYFTSSAELSGRFTAAPADFYFVKTKVGYPDYFAAKNAADAYLSAGYKPAVALLDDYNFTVYLGGFASEADAADAAGRVSGYVLPPDGRRTALADNGQTVLVFDNPYKYGRVAAADGGFIIVGGRAYRGFIELTLNRRGLAAVNVLQTEDYICGVVASEMLLGHIEGAKAQAVACRSYFATQRGVHVSDGFDICDTVHCQNYLGTEKETEISLKAARETAGVMAYYNGEVINATFFSSSGGATANSEDVWNNAIPYLRSVSDSYEDTAKVWERAFTMNDITDLLYKNKINIGAAVSVAVTETAACGRVNRLTLAGTDGSYDLVKEGIRTFFSFAAGGLLESRNFSLSGAAAANVSNKKQEISITDGYVNASLPVDKIFALHPDGYVTSLPGAAYILGADSMAYADVLDAPSAGYFVNDLTPASAANAGYAADTSNIVFYGRGYGHGVGMSQHGANAMARAGFNYIDILKHYYTGIDVR